MTAIDIGEPSEDAGLTEHFMSRADLFRSAHALVDGLKWSDTVSVYDVLQVARFLEDGDVESVVRVRVSDEEEYE
ncbi:hypothetical protein ACFV5M_01740 [Streptomyces albidoflavus]